MTSSEIHLLLNQTPIFGVAIGICGLLYGVLKKERKWTNRALLFFVLLALITIPVSISGMKAADTIRLLPEIDSVTLESHSRIAYISFSMMYALGLLSLITFFIIRKSETYRIFLPVTILGFSIIVFTLMAITGSIGSNIRNNEQVKKSNVFQPYNKLKDQP